MKAAVRYWVLTFFLISCSAQNLSVGFAGGGAAWTMAFADSFLRLARVRLFV